MLLLATSRSLLGCLCPTVGFSAHVRVTKVPHEKQGLWSRHILELKEASLASPLTLTHKFSSLLSLPEESSIHPGYSMTEKAAAFLLIPHSSDFPHRVHLSSTPKVDFHFLSFTIAPVVVTPHCVFLGKIPPSPHSPEPWVTPGAFQLCSSLPEPHPIHKTIFQRHVPVIAPFQITARQMKNLIVKFS